MADNISQFNAGRRTPNRDDGDGFLPMPCETCGCPFFDETHTLAKRSRIVSPSGQDEIRPMIIFRCEACGWIVGTPVDENIRRQVMAKIAEMQSKASGQDSVEVSEETIGMPPGL